MEWRPLPRRCAAATGASLLTRRPGERLAIGGGSYGAFLGGRIPIVGRVWLRDVQDLLHNEAPRNGKKHTGH